MKVDKNKVEIALAVRGMTKKALAEQSGITRQGISAILKRGTCEPKTAGKLAAGLGVAVAEIIEKDDE